MKIYIIDDDQLSLFLTESMLLLEDETLEINTFQSATVALAALKEDAFAPDFIFLDLNMPIMDGWEFLDSLTILEPGLKKACTTYLLTSSVDLADSEKARKYSVVAGMIHKPIEHQFITDILAKAKVVNNSIL